MRIALYAEWRNLDLLEAIQNERNVSEVSASNRIHR